MNHRNKGKKADTEKNMFIPLYIKKQNKTNKETKQKKKGYEVEFKPAP